MAANVNFWSSALGLAYGAGLMYYVQECKHGLAQEKKEVYAMVEKLERPKLDAMKGQYLAEIDAAMAAAGKRKA